MITTCESCFEDVTLIECRSYKTSTIMGVSVSHPYFFYLCPKCEAQTTDDTLPDWRDFALSEWKKQTQAIRDSDA